MFQSREIPAFAVASVIASTHKAIEIIIVNDGSTDDSLDIAYQLKTNHPGIQIIDQPNGGVSKTRNTGMRIAQGEYILPLDGDDLISNDYIERAIEILRSDASVKVVYCNAFKFNEQMQKNGN